MTYAWVITVDHLHQRDPDGFEKDEAGTTGPRGCTMRPEEISGHPKAKEFRMYDDDGELYYSGFYLGPDDETLFAPLDDFGTPNAGATSIYYENGRGSGKFEQL